MKPHEHKPLNPQSKCRDRCQTCGTEIEWNGVFYETYRPEFGNKKKPSDGLWVDIFWGLIIAAVLAFVSVARQG